MHGCGRNVRDRVRHTNRGYCVFGCRIGGLVRLFGVGSASSLALCGLHPRVSQSSLWLLSPAALLPRVHRLRIMEPSNGLLSARASFFRPSRVIGRFTAFMCEFTILPRATAKVVCKFGCWISTRLRSTGKRVTEFSFSTSVNCQSIKNWSSIRFSAISSFPIEAKNDRFDDWVRYSTCAGHGSHRGEHRSIQH
jgi:hypothetical protein